MCLIPLQKTSGWYSNSQARSWLEVATPTVKVIFPLWDKCGWLKDPPYFFGVFHFDLGAWLFVQPSGIFARKGGIEGE